MDNALLTSTPEGANLKKMLLAHAKYQGHMMIVTRRNPWTLEPQRVPFHEITHYFNDEYGELGMIAFSGSQCESILLFDDRPRQWAPAFLANVRITPVGIYWQ